MANRGLCSQSSDEESEGLAYAEESDDGRGRARSCFEDSAQPAGSPLWHASSFSSFHKGTSTVPRIQCSPGGVRMFLAALALVALTAYAGYRVLNMPPPGEEQSFIPTTHRPASLMPAGLSARELLESPELAELATQQLMEAGHEALRDTDRHMVHAVARAGFGNISLMLRDRAPATARQLSSFQLTAEQKRAVLGVVQNMGDSRVQGVGRELSQALRAFLSTSPADGRAAMEKHIRRELQPRLRQIRQLRDEVIPAPLRRLDDASSSRWGVNLDTESMRVVKTFDNHWELEFDMSRPKRGERALRRLAPEERLSKQLGVAGGVVEQARVLLEQLKAVLGQFGIQAEVPAWITSLDGRQRPFVWDLLRCLEDSAGDVALAISCPMKFASAGIDVCSSIQGEEQQQEATPQQDLDSSVLWRHW